MASPQVPQRTLIGFVGAGDYFETVYRWHGIGDCKSAHIAAALGTLWKPAAILLLATEAAEEKNGRRVRQSLAASGLPEPVFKRLPDGRTEEELWIQFQVLREAIELAAGGEVLIDITHGFRAQPFFAGAVLSVLSAAGLEPGNLALVYGEYRKDEPTSPIWDLTLFTELMDWAQALGLFLKTGVAEPVVKLGRQVRRREAERAHASGSGVYPRFGQLVQAIERFADDIATVRVASIITGYDSRKRSAVGSAATLLEAIEKCREEVAAKVPPLSLILGQLAEGVHPLAADELYGKSGELALGALAHHYLSLARYPEAAIVVREAQINRQALDNRAVEVNSSQFNDEQRKCAEDRFKQRDPGMREIADIRNDIEHGGFREQPLSADALKKRISRLVERFAPGDRTEADGGRAGSSPSARSRTFFVTRHRGATEWATRQGIAIDRTVEHLDLAEIQPGDVVIGTLPVHLAAEVCARQARYLHLALELPAEHRGLELTAEDMVRFGARLVEHRVTRTST